MAREPVNLRCQEHRVAEGTKAVFQADGFRVSGQHSIAPGKSAG